MFCVTLIAYSMDKEDKEKLRAKQVQRKEEWIKKHPEKAALFKKNGKDNSLLINGDSADIVKLKEGVEARGQKINNVLQQTSALRTSTIEYQQGINELKNVPMTKKGTTTILINNGNPVPNNPNNSTTLAHTDENKPLVKVIIVEQKPESNCLDKFFCCGGDWCEEEE